MKISKHASKRARQRGIKDHDIDIMLYYGENIKKLSGKVYEYSIKKKVEYGLVKSLQTYINYLKNQSSIKNIDRFIKDAKKLINSIEKSSRKKLVVNQDMNTIITVY